MVEIQNIKILPSNIDAEKWFLSCIFLEPNLINISILQPYHFYNPEYKKVYEAIKKVYSKNNEVMVVSVHNELSDFNIDILYDISSFALTSTQFETHQKIILEHYNRRKIIRSAQDLMNLSYDKTQNIDDILLKATSLGNTIDSLDEAKKLVSWSFSTMERYFDRKEKPTILDDMWYDFLSAILWWYRAWGFYVLAWWTWQWKSSFWLNLCIEALKRWIKCSFFSTEMPAHDIHTRFVSREWKIPSWKIEKGKEDIAEEVMEVISKIDVYLEDCNIYDTFDTRENLERLIVKEASLWSKIIFIDYLQQVKLKWTNRNLSLWDMTTSLKKLAIKYNICIVWLSQLNREGQNKTEPSLKDLRDSWSIEQDADVVIFLHWFDENVVPNTIGVYVLKNRHGEKWMQHIVFDKRYFLFVNPKR